MTFITAAAIVIGNIVMVAGGLLLAVLMLCFASAMAGRYAYSLWKNLSAIYRLDAIQYWFAKMQEDGTHVLSKAHYEALTKKGSEQL